MTDYLLTVLAILVPWLIAVAIMRKPSPRTIVKGLIPVSETEEHEVYDPSQDPEKIMKGELESYFD